MMNLDVVAKLFLALALSVVVACGGDDEVLPDAGGTIADAAVGIDADPNAPDAEPTATAYALATDFDTVGVLSTIDIPGLQVTQNAIAGVASPDAVIRQIGDLVYILNRFGGASVDNVTIIDPATNQLVTQISTGDNTNPQDVARVGDKLYVAALNSADIIVLDATDAGATPTKIDLSSLDLSGDGNPDPSAIALVGDTLFVALEHLEYVSEFDVPSRGGTVAMIDTKNDTLLGSIELANDNPLGFFAHDGDDLLIATVNRFPPFGGKEPFTGCVERITTSGTPAAAGCVIDAAGMGGYATDIEVADGAIWLTVTTSTSFDASRVLVTDSNGTITTEMFSSAGQGPIDIAICPTGHVVTNDSTFGASGYRVYTADGQELTTDALDIGVPHSFQNAVICR